MEIYEMCPSETSHKESNVFLCVWECVWQRSAACRKGLRYPLLLSVAAMRLVVPRGHRWHRNPQSHSEKVTKKHSTEWHPHLLTHPFTAANRFLGLVSACAISPSSILWKLRHFFFFSQVYNREQSRNALKCHTVADLTRSSLMRIKKIAVLQRTNRFLSELLCYDV